MITRISTGNGHCEVEKRPLLDEVYFDIMEEEFAAVDLA